MSKESKVHIYIEFHKSVLPAVLSQIKKFGLELTELKPLVYRATSQDSPDIAPLLENLKTFAPEDSEIGYRVLIDSSEHMSEELLETLKHLEWNHLYLSDSFQKSAPDLLINHRMVEVELVEKGTHVKVHQLIEKPESLAPGLSSLTHMNPAPFPKRVIAALIDYGLAISLLLLMNALTNFSTVYPVYLAEKWLETENGNLEHARVEPLITASGAELVRLGKRGKVENTFPFPTGNYRVSLIERVHSVDKPTVEINLGQEKFRLEKKDNNNNIVQYRLPRIVRIDNLAKITVSNVSNTDSYQLDSLLFVEASDPVYTDTDETSKIRQEHFLRLIGFWRYTDLKYHIWDLTAKCGSIFLLIHLLFLSFLNWTPGCWIAGIRVTARGRAGAPGFRQSLLRCLGYTVSIPCAGIGWFWPLISNKNDNWADIFSRTKSIEFQWWEDEV